MESNLIDYIQEFKRMPATVATEAEEKHFNVNNLQMNAFKTEYTNRIKPMLVNILSIKKYTVAQVTDPNFKIIEIMETQPASDKTKVTDVQESVDWEDGIKANEIIISSREKYSKDAIGNVLKVIKTSKKLPLNLKSIGKGILLECKRNSTFVDEKAPAIISYKYTESGAEVETTLSMVELKNTINQKITNGTTRGFARAMFNLSEYKNLWYEDITKIKNSHGTISLDSTDLHFPGAYLTKAVEGERLSEDEVYQLVDCVPEEIRSPRVNDILTKYQEKIEKERTTTKGRR
jgi:hypothetical protein